MRHHVVQHLSGDDHRFMSGGPEEAVNKSRQPQKPQRSRRETLYPSTCSACSAVKREIVSDALALLCHFRAHVKGRKPLRKRTIASGGSRPSVGKSLRERQKSPQAGTGQKTCGLRRRAAREALFPRRLACSRRSGFWPDQSNVTK